MKTTIVIPVAGKAERLSLPIPKELLPIAKGKTAIDNVFEHIKSISHKVNVIVVISIFNIETVKYLEKYSDSFDISFIFQKPSFDGFVGALRSAQHLFSSKVLLLLPDQMLVMQENKFSVFDKILKHLEDHEAAFLVVKEDKYERFRDDGALTVEKIKLEVPIITNYVEKPLHPDKNLNAVWAAIAFRSSVANQIFVTMQKNFSRELTNEEFRASPFYNAPAVYIKECIDIGVWERYTSWVNRSTI